MINLSAMVIQGLLILGGIVFGIFALVRKPGTSAAAGMAWTGLMLSAGTVALIAAMFIRHG